MNVPSPNMNNWGDPLAKALNDSSGPGSGAGIGSGSGGGMGSGNGGGVGPGSGGVPAAAYLTPAPAAMAIPPALLPARAVSDEAVKAKYQGTVSLIAVITADGRATDIHVARASGSGSTKRPSTPFALGASNPRSARMASPRLCVPSKLPSICTEAVGVPSSRAGLLPTSHWSARTVYHHTAGIERLSRYVRSATMSGMKASPE